MADLQNKSPEQTLLESALPESYKNNLSPDDLEQQEYARIQELVTNCIGIGEEYRMRFRRIWDEIERQVRQVPPVEWDKKEEWQSKVYIGQQAKTSESVYANLNAMVFPSEQFFSLSATKQKDRDEEQALEDLFGNLLMRGGFFYQKDIMLEESIDQGTSFIKMLAKKDKSGIDFSWRSCYDCLVDPHCRNDWSRARFWVDQFPKDADF